jgi:hypothetical protein
LRRALHQGGLDVQDDRSLCGDPGLVTTLETDDLFCSVYRDVPYPKFKAHPHMRFEGPNYSGKAYVVAYANVDCWNYAHGAQGEAIAASLRRLFRSFGATSYRVGRY